MSEYGYSVDTPAGVRWAELAASKLAELDATSQRIDTMRAALQRISRCSCHASINARAESLRNTAGRLGRRASWPRTC